MFNKIIYYGCMVALVVGLWTVVLMSIPKHGVIRYDCRIAEISPDFPIEVREECRKRNSGRI